jgi:histidyl-tRNA synthetase
VSPYLPTAPYRGTRDFLPGEMSIREQVFDKLYEVIEGYGYQRYDGPILESAEIYEAKTSREIVEQQLYTLTDRGGRRLALRPEMTPSVARMIAGNAGRLQFPVRWYTHVNCHRYERPQRGRVREHWQINVDIFGTESLNAEIEIFSLIHDLMASTGAGRETYVLRANDRILLESMLTDIIGVSEDRTREVASLIDRWEKYDRAALLAEGLEAGLTEAQFEHLEKTLQSGEELLAELPAEVRERSPLVAILESDARELVTFDPLIVRGFEYYTSTVFEVFDRDPANRRSLFGGGRYDNLAGLFSSQRIPGIGFGMGDVTLFDFLETHNLLPEPRSEADVVVIPLDAELAGAAREVAGRLREGGRRTVVPFEPRKLGKEISRADKSGAKAVVIIGASGWAEGNVTIRRLADGSQEDVPAAEVAGRLTELLESPPA